MDCEEREVDDYFVFNIEDYLKTLNAYKQKYKGKLKIKIGMVWTVKKEKKMIILFLI